MVHQPCRSLLSLSAGGAGRVLLCPSGPPRGAIAVSIQRSSSTRRTLAPRQLRSPSRLW